VKHGDDVDALDHQRLASLLDISFDEVAVQLEVAKGCSLIWGIRAG
jgi:hypothetical protein